MRKYLYIICDTCEGHGTVDNPAFSNGITSSGCAEDWDHESRKAYLNGQYDVRCSCCDGSGKIKIPNIAAMTFSEKRELVIQRQNARLEEEFRREREIERSMGC